MPQKWRDVHRQDVNVAPLKSSDELRQLLAAEFKDYIDQGLLQLPAPEMKEINKLNKSCQTEPSQPPPNRTAPRHGNGHDNEQ